MAKKRQWILMLLAFLFAVCAVGAVSAWYADTVTVYAAPGGDETEFFGAYQGEKTDGNHHFYQYEYGCAYAYEGVSATVFWGGRQWKANLTENKTDALTREEVYAKTDVLDISSRVGYEQNDATEAVLEHSNGKPVKDIGLLFQARYEELKDTITLGTPSSGVKVWDGYIFEDFCYGESDVSFNWGPRSTNYSGLCYNPGTGEVFYITGGYASAFEQLKGGKSALGQMLSDSGISLAVGSETWTVQLFENGYIRKMDNGSYKAVTGYIYDEGSKTFVKQATLTGEYGDKVGSVFTVGDMYYQNFQNGYAQYYLLGGEYVIRYYGNRNIAQDGTVKFVDKSVYTAEILTAEIGENEEQAKTIRSETGLSDDSALRALFTDAMDRAVAAGFGLGVPCSPIKIWNGMIMMDFKLGDGRFSFGGDRYNMSFIVYNPEDKKAYAVSNYAVQWVNGEVFSYGLPVSDIHTDGTFKLNSAEIEYAYMQEFEQGVLYTTKDGMLVAELGVGYDEESGSYVPQVAPSVPKQYGDRTDMRTEGNYTYINYEKGCVTAERNNEGYYTYTLHPGRNFSGSSTEPTLLPLEDLIQKSDLQFAMVDYGMPVEELRELVYSEIQKYYNAGFFVGFLEDRFKPWNDIDAQQFIWGDSTADPFKEEGRRYVAALALDRETKELYLLRDEVLNVWQDNYAVLGFPTTNSTYYAEQGISVQEFELGFIVTDGLQAYAITDDSLEDFLQDFERVQVPTHEQDESKGYIAEGSAGNIGSSGGSENTGLIIGISCAAGAVVIAAAVAAIILIRRRKKVK